MIAFDAIERLTGGRLGVFDVPCRRLVIEATLRVERR
jgi:hypothetical protein